jgi:tRNA(fMet)-specific endonuclease VapC
MPALDALDVALSTVGIAGDEPVALAAITASELLVGVALADEAHRDARETFVNSVLSLFAVVPFALAEARAHARLLADLRRSGVTIGTADLQIAATCLANRYGVLTLNRRDFDRVPGLRVLAPPR